jgi:hypothetical protein
VGRQIVLVIGNSEYDDASLARLITPSEDVSAPGEAGRPQPAQSAFLIYRKIDTTEPA